MRRHSRTTVYSAANVRPRSSSLTFSCSTVKPVTYEPPAQAPTITINRAAGTRLEVVAARMSARPLAMTANSKTVSRGTRFCMATSVMTPSAAPTPSAVISTPNSALPPAEDLLGEHRTERDHRRAADEPDPDPDEHATDHTVLPDEADAVGDVAERGRPVDPLGLAVVRPRDR